MTSIRGRIYYLAFLSNQNQEFNFLFVTICWTFTSKNFKIKIKNSIFCSWQFVEHLRSRKVNIYEVRSAISIHDISFMISTVLIEGGTTWDWKFIQILMVGLCWLYIKLFTHFCRLWGGKLVSVLFKILTLLLAVSLLENFCLSTYMLQYLQLIRTSRKSVLIMRWEVMSYILWHITYDFYCTFWRRNDMGREICTHFDGRAVLTLYWTLHSLVICRLWIRKISICSF